MRKPITYRIPQLSNYRQFNKMSWARLTKKLNRSRSVSTINNNNNNLNFEKIRTSPSISEETVNSITSVLSKGGLISEGIFNLVPSSRKWTKCLSLTFQPNVKNLRVVILFNSLEDGTKLKMPSDIKSP